MSFAIESFIDNVERFCEWAEGDKHELLEARNHLITLMTSIPWLMQFRDVDYDEVNISRRSHESWKNDHARFADLPFQYYQTVFDSHNIESTDEVIMGDLHDDLADVYGDLWHGMQAYQAGEAEVALSIWIDSYFIHWGHHASSALKAIDDFYLQQNYLFNEDSVFLNNK